MEALATSSAEVALVMIQELNVPTEPSMRGINPQLVGMALKSQSMSKVKILLPLGPPSACPAVAGAGVPSTKVGCHWCKV